MKTSEGVSPGLTGTEATITFAGFVGLYAALLGLYAYVIARVIRNGPPGGDDLRTNREPTPTPGAPATGVADDD
jgi:cytochrome d ubiquinol oxidase subunit I